MMNLMFCWVQVAQVQQKEYHQKLFKRNGKIRKYKKMQVFLATGKNEDEQKILMEILNTKFREKCVALDNLSIKETLPIIKNCNVAICNDTSFSHLSSALELKQLH